MTILYLNFLLHPKKKAEINVILLKKNNLLKRKEKKIRFKTRLDLYLYLLVLFSVLESHIVTLVMSLGARLVPSIII